MGDGEPPRKHFPDVEFVAEEHRPAHLLSGGGAEGNRQESVCKCFRGELTAFVGIEDLGATVLRNCLFHSIHVKSAVNVIYVRSAQIQETLLSMS